ncbi:MAG: anthranilate synthase component I family protein [Thermoplasmata archaeon]|nr:anthranilate synthase component I family protein [Thermoplasmata archaeon]
MAGIYFGAETGAEQAAQQPLMMSVSIESEMKHDPVSIFSCLREEFPGESFLLESVEGTRKTARYSFIGVAPISKFRARDQLVEIDDEVVKTGNPYAVLQEYFKSIKCGASEIAPFSGGAVGYLGYGMVKHFERIKEPESINGQLPDAVFIVPKHLVCIDHLNSRTFLISHGKLSDLREALKKVRPIESSGISIGESRTNIDQDEFEKMVMTAKESILDGEIFQVVLSRKTDFKIKGDPVEMYKALRALNPSPYLFYLDFDDVHLLGSSPEMLVRLEGNKLITRPLAGTRPRSPDIEEDEKLKLDMLLDEKERAEHLMLVDLHRNDMGRVSKSGSVKVTELMSVEKYSHVQHIVSNVESEIHPNYDGFDALRSCFPAGTVTGAPKIRAMQIISELEKSPRGPYAGAVGYFDFTGNMDFAITIRSISVTGNKASIQAGAGIVADSVPQREFQETEHKMGAMLQAIRSLQEGQDK